MDNYNFSLTLDKISQITQSKLEGDGNIVVNGIATLDKAAETEISFLVSPKYQEQLKETKAVAIIADLNCESFGKNILRSKDPRFSFAKLMQYIQEHYGKNESLIEETAVIGKNCNIGEDVYIGHNVVIGDNVVIGNHTRIMANVTLYDNVSLGTHCNIGSGTVIGSDGFGFALGKGKWEKIPHFGGVTIGNYVDIGSNTTIDRGLLDDTTIGDHVIIDNLVQIAHNVKIGKMTAIAGCVGIAGSTTVGQNCLIGGGTGISGHISIGDNVHITAMSGINSTIQKSGSYSSGLPVKTTDKWRRNVACFNNLNEFFKRLKKLEKQTENI